MKPKDLTLRDYFAVKALIGLLSGRYGQDTIKDDVEAAYKYADHMMEERKKK